MEALVLPVNLNRRNLTSSYLLLLWKDGWHTSPHIPALWFILSSHPCLRPAIFSLRPPAGCNKEIHVCFPAGGLRGRRLSSGSGYLQLPVHQEVHNSAGQVWEHYNDRWHQAGRDQPPHSVGERRAGRLQAGARKGGEEGHGRGEGQTREWDLAGSGEVLDGGTTKWRHQPQPWNQYVKMSRIYFLPQTT